MNEAHLVLLTKLEELDAYTHTVLHQFPKLERHLLCADLRDTTRGDVDQEHVRQRVCSFLAYSKHCQAQRTVDGVL